MCSATLGAAPVNWCTWAASAFFSYGSRGTPFWANTLNLVPEFPNAHEGNSMLRSRKPSAIRCSGVMSSPPLAYGHPMRENVAVIGLYVTVGTLSREVEQHVHDDETFTQLSGP